MGKSYPNRQIPFLYQLQYIETFKPTWKEVLRRCPEVGVEDVLYFAGVEQNI